MSAQTVLVSGRVRLIALSAVMVLPLGACAPALARKLDAFRSAKKRGDYAAANKYLSSDARIWFGEKKGPGNPYTAKGGPYKEWDREFRSTSIREKPEVRGQTVTFLSTETNDYYRLLERESRPARITYYFKDGLITGMLYQGNALGLGETASREDEFRAWAETHYPGLLDSEEMKIPNNPRRWRELLTEWRREAGLPPIDP